MARKMLLKLALVGLLPAAVACEAQDVSLQIVQMQSVIPGTCKASTDIASGLPLGTVDLALAKTYVGHVLVRNKMADINNVQSFGPEDGRVATLDVTLREAIVEYSALGPITAELPNREVLPLAGTVTLGAESVLDVPLLNSSALEAIRSAPEFLVTDSQGQVRAVRTEVTINTKLRFRGVTLDGREVETNSFTFPVRVCNGCMVSYPAEAMVPGVGGVPQCVQPGPEDEMGALVCPAQAGSDGFFVDCRDCLSSAVDSIGRSLCQPPSGL